MSAFSLQGIGQALGGEVKRNRYVTAPGPQHSRHDRSLKVWLDEGGRICCTSYSPADSWADCMDHVRARLGLPAFVPGKREAKSLDRRSPEERLAEAIAVWESAAAVQRADNRYAERLWNEAIDLGGTPGEVYLGGRHLALSGDMAGRTVRFHPACPRGDERLPALIVRFSPISHAAEAVAFSDDPPVTCVQRIFLVPSKPKGHDGKWLIGHPFSLPQPFLHDGIVTFGASEPLLAMKLSGDEEVEEGLFLAEGFESGLAAMHFGFRPLWAVYSARAIELFPLLGGISALTIMADHDRPKHGRAEGAGQLAARQCRERWRKAYREQPFLRHGGARFAVLVDTVEIHVPETPGDDWADAWMSIAMAEPERISPEEARRRYGRTIPPDDEDNKAQPNGAARDSNRNYGPLPGNGNTAPPIEAHAFVWRPPETIPRRAWLYPGLYVRAFVTVTIATGAVGKTGECLVEAVALVLGRDLLTVGHKFPVGTQCRVWYWNGEDPLVEMERQVHAIFRHYKFDEADRDGLAKRLFLDSGRDTRIDLVKDGPKNTVVINVEAKQHLIDTIRQNAIDVAIFDPVADFATAAQNSNEVMNAIVKTCGEIAVETNCAIGLVHHSRKTNGQEVSVEDARGGSALVAGTRIARVLNRMTANEAAKAGVRSNAYRRYFRMSSDKVNLTPPRLSTTFPNMRTSKGRCAKR